MVWKTSRGEGSAWMPLSSRLIQHTCPVTTPFPSTARRRSSCRAKTFFVSRAADGSLPQVDRPVVWLSGDGASISSLTLRGNPRPMRHRGP